VLTKDEGDRVALAGGHRLCFATVLNVCPVGINVLEDAIKTETPVRRTDREPGNKARRIFRIS
jgi:hypothetical protein